MTFGPLQSDAGPPLRFYAASIAKEVTGVQEEAVDKRWVIVLGCWLAAAVSPVHAGAPLGLFTIVDGGEVTILRDAQKLRAAEGVRLTADDIVHVGDKARVVRLELLDGTTYDVGPGSRLMVGSPTFGPSSGRPAQVYLAEGWIKAASARGAKPVPAAVASPRLDLVGLDGSAVLRATAEATQVFLEGGRVEAHERRNDQDVRTHKLREGQFYVQKGAAAGAVRNGLPTDLVDAMPRAFMDALPRRASRFAAMVIEPGVAGNLSYADASPWLHGEAVLRPGFLQRWGLKARDPAWRPGLLADLRLHAEWEPLLTPPRRRATARLPQPREVAARELPSPAALVRVLSKQAEAAAPRQPVAGGPVLPTEADAPVVVKAEPAPRPTAAAPAAAAALEQAVDRPPATTSLAAASEPTAAAAPAAQGSRAPIVRSEPAVPGASPLSERAQ